MNKKNLLIYGGIAAASAGVGFGAGYLVFKKKYEAIAEAEIESVKEAYAKNAKNANKPDLPPKRESFVESDRDLAEETIVDEGYLPLNDETDADAFRQAHGRVPSTYELIQMGKGISAEDAIRNANDTDDSLLDESNIFDDPQPDPEDLGEGEDEVPPRSPDRPYIIKASDWYLNETDFSQITLTYWADDDILADDADRMVNDVDNVVGNTNLHRFGTLSEDPDKVYVRNERLKVDYEITKDERSYTEVIVGVKAGEFDKGDTSPRRMRSNDN